MKFQTNTCPTCGMTFPETGLPGFSGMCPNCLLSGISFEEEEGPDPGLVGKQIGRYTLIEEIGVGGMGSVWRARQVEPIQREVALKIVKLGMDTRELVSRFEAERQVLAGLDHPNIAKVFDAGATEEGRPYYVMELVDGLPITDYAKRHGLSIADRLSLFDFVCKAVQHAHDKNIVHRDLKPTNILVADHVDSHLKVIDFGIAKATGTALAEQTLCTREGQILGTPGYMSPEQANGCEDVDGRSDVYSLGALLYELLSGSPPFNSETLRDAGLLEVIRMIREDDPPRPSTRLDQAGENQRQRGTVRIPGDLDWIVLKALAKDPDGRYASPADLAEDLGRYTRGEAVIASAPGVISRSLKFLRRHRTASISVAVALLVGVVTFLATFKGRKIIEEGRLTVTTLADSGPGSLREVIANAPPRATIRFAENLAGETIRLGGSQIEIKGSLSIDASALADAQGSLTGITIDAGGRSRHFLISENSATVEMTGLKLVRGDANTKPGEPIANAGGAIHSSAILKLLRCELSGNKAAMAGAVHTGDGGHLIAEDSLFVDNAVIESGGAIFSNWGCNIDLKRCTLARNRAHDGGAIYGRTRVTIENTTIAGNVCSGNERLSHLSSGGGVSFRGGEMGLWNCTIVGNRADEAGGIYVSSESIVSIHNTIVAGNQSGDASTDLEWNELTIVHNHGGNFVGNCAGHEQFFPVTGAQSGNQTGYAPAVIDPLLAPLGDHGGLVPTMPPLPGSPVIDRGVSHGEIPLRDARRNGRTLDGDGDGVAIPDAGAVEFVPSQ